MVHDFDLRQNESREDCDLEHDENLVLEGLARVIQVEEGQAGEQRNDDVVKEAGEKVVGRPPMCKIGSVNHGLDLVPER